MRNEASDHLMFDGCTADFALKAPDIDPTTKTYIDEACQRTILTILDQVKDLLNQQRESQQQWNEQFQKTIKDRFIKLKQANWANIERQPSVGQLAEKTNASPVTISSDTRELINQGNYPSTPILNDIIANITTTEAPDSGNNRQKDLDQLSKQPTGDIEILP
ncbi:3955_t:CDS:2 [Gigaspora margarita]|uniref:3955_t:CDS:1 n=1 Tax=Gigaspora margarita TaxID=4874 RepID=A0ABM8W1Q5_GIGMA|nr:3955_t:CDS:2 [Gigaspora margarita]